MLGGLCTGARVSEIASAGSDCLIKDGEDLRLRARTYKLHAILGGVERDWPLHPTAGKAIEIQNKLRYAAGATGRGYLWVMRAYTSTLYTSQVFHKTQLHCFVFGKLPRGGLLLDRHQPPLTRRFVVYYCSAVRSTGNRHGSPSLEGCNQGLLR